MIRRLYIHNFRCLENFELPISGQSSVLLIGKNGAGKTTVGLALEILQKIGRGTNRVGDLVRPKDFARGRTDVPMRFEIEVELERQIYGYAVAFELPEGFKELRVLEEKLMVGSKPVYTREVEQVHLAITGRQKAADFRIDWHLVALPIIQPRSNTDPLSVLKQWLHRMHILRPMPGLILGDSNERNAGAESFGHQLRCVVCRSVGVRPICLHRCLHRDREYLRQVMPDLKDIKNPVVGTDSRSLVVQFSNDQGSAILPFEDLSDGEKCFMICALVLAANQAYGPVFCFWDEPDNYLALSEVGHFVLAPRKAFQAGGQFIATSHNSEAIRRFSGENTLVLYRRNHLEPTIARPLSEIQVSGDLVGALIRDDVEP